MKNIFLILLIASVIIQFSCKKEKFDENPKHKLLFSTDTIIFDTVFTTVGTISKTLKVYNPYNETIRISEIKVASGIESNFTINIDGTPSNHLTDVDILPKDSLYIFIRATIDPNNKNTPMIVTDSILFTANNSISDVKLVAFGQDAHFIIPNKKMRGISGYNIIAGEGERIKWNNDKPYVIYGYAVVDSLGSLTIGPGVKIYFHKNSGLWIYKGGSLKVKGEKDSLVTFQGDRRDAWFRDKPGQWDRIWINESNARNEINYAVIKNGFIGIQTQILDKPMDVNQLVLNNVIIENMSAWGIFSRMYRINASNTIIQNCGEVCAYLTQGGNYEFRHCTFSNYWSGSVRQTPALVITNYYKDMYSGIIYASDLENCYFGNSIIYGNTESELSLDNQYGGAFNYRFENCLIKQKTIPTDTAIYYPSCIYNETTAFIAPDNGNVHIALNSAAINKGKKSIALLMRNDYDEVDRLADGLPDLGAFEYAAPK